MSRSASEIIRSRSPSAIDNDPKLVPTSCSPPSGGRADADCWSLYLSLPFCSLGRDRSVVFTGMGVQLIADPNEKPVSSNLEHVPMLIIEPMENPLAGSKPPSTGCGIRTSCGGGGACVWYCAGV